MTEKEIIELLKEKIIILEKTISDLKNVNEELIQENNMLKKQKEKYQHEANYDALTGIKNRRLIANVVNYDVMAMCDIDNFKKVNDTYGHDIGDVVLQKIAEILKENLRINDEICRYGGEEFLIILNNCSLENAYKKIENIRNFISENSIKYFGFNITVSFGLASKNKNENNNEVIKKADKALYEAKETGKNKTVIFDEINRKRRI